MKQILLCKLNDIFCNILWKRTIRWHRWNKWLVARASLRRPYQTTAHQRPNQTTAHQFFQFVDSKIDNMNCEFVTLNNYEHEAEQLKERFSKARTIPGTQKLHSICFTFSPTYECLNSFLSFCRYARTCQH